MLHLEGRERATWSGRGCAASRLQLRAGRFWDLRPRAAVESVSKESVTREHAWIVLLCKLSIWFQSPKTEAKEIKLLPESPEPRATGSGRMPSMRRSRACHLAKLVFSRRTVSDLRARASYLHGAGRAFRWSSLRRISVTSGISAEGLRAEPEITPCRGVHLCECLSVFAIHLHPFHESHSAPLASGLHGIIPVGASRALEMQRRRWLLFEWCQAVA